MSKDRFNLVLIPLLCVFGFVLGGCSDSQEDAAVAKSFSLNEPEGEEEEEDEADDPNRGPRGGRITPLSGGKETEIHFDEEAKLFTVYIDGLGDVKAVKATTKVGEEVKDYEFERTDTPGGSLYGLLDEELAAAVMKGKDEVQISIAITTAEGELTADYEHHSH